MFSRLSLGSICLIAFCLAPVASMSAEDFQLYTVKREQVSVHIAIAGTVSARKSVQLTAQIPGRIQHITGQEGDRFRQGDLLVQIDDRALRAKLDAAIASRDAALASIRNANMQLNRERYSPQSRASGQAPGGMGMPAMMDQMFTNPMQNVMGMRDRGLEQDSDLVSRETQLAQANTQYKQAEAQIREIQAALRDARSVAPFDGVVETVYVEQGDTLQPGQPILNFSETGGYQIEADVPARIRSALQEGDLLDVRLDGADPPIKARVTRIFPVADPRQHTVRVEMELPQGTRATVGQYAEVQVPDMQAQRVSDLVIPRSAVIKKGGLPLVYSVGDNGMTRLRVVRLGENLGTGFCIVLSGLREGDVILDEPPPGMTAGVSVKEALDKSPSTEQK